MSEGPVLNPHDDETELIPLYSTTTPTQKSVTLTEDQFNALVSQHQEYKQDIITLVNVFRMFSGFFGADASLPKMLIQLPKLVKNKNVVDQISAMTPIIQKYTPKTPESNGEES